MSKLGETFEEILQEGSIQITIISIEEDDTVTIEVLDIGGKQDTVLATGVCDWGADDSLEDVLIEVLDLAIPEDQRLRSAGAATLPGLE